MKIVLTSSSLSKASVHSSTLFNGTSWVLCSGRKPDCAWWSREFSSRKHFGHNWDGSIVACQLLVPSLWYGVMFAAFHSVDICPVLGLVLKSSVWLLAIPGAVILRILAWTWFCWSKQTVRDSCSLTGRWRVCKGTIICHLSICGNQHRHTFSLIMFKNLFQFFQTCHRSFPLHWRRHLGVDRLHQLTLKYHW